ncbi:MAG: RluA family pseudouridine synthase [Polyangiales bacterium]
MSERARAFEVDSHEVGDRVDKCAAARLASEGVSRGDVLRAIESDALRVNGRAVKASYRVRAGDRVELELPRPAPSEALPEDIAIDVVFEDESVLVVNKPAGLVVHPARGHASGTLVNAVLFHHAVDDDEAPERPGIVHRLDRDTSGVMVIAKTPLARERLKAQFQAHSIERVYEAIAVGVIERAVTFDTLYNRHPTERMRFSSRVREGKRACTHVTPVEAFASDATRVECRLETGRTHQIRVHLSDNGHALLGDAMYGKPPKSPRLRAIADALGRQALHARVLGFVHPASGEFVRFERQPPEDFARALEALRAERG